MPLLLLMTALVASPDVDALLETAQAYLGTSYVYGDQGTQGFDCSGFVQRVFAAHGASLPRTSREQAGVGARVGWEQVRAGDLLFFTDRPGGTRVTHVGIALDGERMIHASTGRREVVIDTLDMTYYRERRLFARRVLEAPPDAEAALANQSAATEATLKPAPVKKKATSSKARKPAKKATPKPKAPERRAKTKRV